MVTPVYPSKTKILSAFMVVYVLWGSTYLAIRFVVEVLPPFLTAGVRFLVAGTVLYGWARWRGATAPVRLQWRDAAVIGGLLFVGGNGGVMWAQQQVPSGVAALLVATVPMWMVLIEWRRGGGRPSVGVAVGLLLGLMGVALLIGPSLEGGVRVVAPVGAVVLLVAALLWACGSLYARRAALPDSALLSAAMQMLCGGALLVLIGCASGELPRFLSAEPSWHAWAGLAHLIIFGALIGFTAYAWLLRVVSVSSVSTYAYVNPVVAVILGCLVAREPVTWNILAAAGMIVAGVALIISMRAGGTLARQRA